ncbi:DMT family transporter [Candidatus Woesearchaeota archaeon]|nr:DMT family transporter [Candidatus Woesearchaeota archaeon]
MLEWIYFVLIAQGIWSITSLIDKFVISKGYIKNPLVYIVLNGLMNVLLIFLLPFFGFEPLKLADLLIGIFGGIIFSASVVMYYKAVQYEEISRIAMLFQSGPIFVLVLSFLFLGEMLTKNHILGFLFLLSAGFVVSYKRADSTFKLSKSFHLMLISMLLSSIGFVIAKYIYTITSFWNAFLWLRISGFTALGVLLSPSVRKDSLKTFKAMKPKIKSLMIFKMVIDFSAFIFAGYALLNGPASLVSALSNSVLPLFVFMLALVASIYLPKLIKEKIDKRSILIKVLAIVFIMVGILFINLK